MDDLIEKIGSWVNTLPELLTSLDSPLAASSVIIAALVFIFKSCVIPIWATTAEAERRRINQLSTAFTDQSFREVMGCEPRAFRDLGTPDTGLSGLRSRFYVLRRTYVEAFIDKENRVYGYTVSLRRPTLMGGINVGGLKVRLGHSTFSDVWPDGARLICLPSVRNYSVFEATTGTGASADRTWAIGFRDFPFSKKTWRWTIKRIFNRTRDSSAPHWEHTLWNAALGFGDLDKILDVPHAWHIDSEVQQARQNIHVTSVVVAFQDEISFSMVKLHSWDIFHFDPPKSNKH